MKTTRENQILSVSLCVGTATWLGRLAIIGVDPLQAAWAESLLLLAPLVIVPLALSVLLRGPLAGRTTNWLHSAIWLQLPAAGLLLPAFVLPNGLTAAVLCVPWLLVTGLIAAAGAAYLRDSWLSRERGDAALSAGMIFLPIGAGWLILSRHGLRPLDFKAIIVLLTAIHFHFAGFVLPLLAGLCARHHPSQLDRLTVPGVIVGVPLVAVGITVSQLGFHPVWECLAAGCLSVTGCLVAIDHFRLSLRPMYPTASRWLWRISSVALLAGMVLSALYGIRSFAPIPGLDIPWMRALHGTANAIGFAVCGLWAWNLALRGGDGQP